MKSNKKYIRESFRLYLPPAVGYNFPLLINLLRKYGVDNGYYARALVISLISMIGVPFRIYEKLAYDRKAEKHRMPEPPVFILGHWRSGTTHLHNLLCQDPQSAYVTTYQSVFPDQTLAPLARFVFKNIMKMLIPVNRKGDNVKLGSDYPQEEEFALAARSPASYYFFWYFPEMMLQFFDDFLSFEQGDKKLREAFITDYRRLIKKALINTGNGRFLSKNPVHTGRIPLLLEMFPDARFIHIHRNPVDVILSTRHFFSKMMPGLTLHKVDYDKINEDIYTVYRRLMQQYLDTRAMIPEGNLVEVRYDDLTANPIAEIERIYKAFGFSGYARAKPRIEAYAEMKKNYVGNKYDIKQSLLDEILEQTNFTMKHYGYNVPDGLGITGK
ncbi:MAG: sulfotransferase [Bacteroidales bacterium]|nr:sulfotransferase [Bacteroidales bacterium]